MGETTDIVEKEMYTFEDRGGRESNLRPEGTAAVVRSFVENKVYADPQPTKWYYIGPMFRYEHPQAEETPVSSVRRGSVRDADPGAGCGDYCPGDGFYSAVGLRKVTGGNQQRGLSPLPAGSPGETDGFFEPRTGRSCARMPVQAGTESAAHVGLQRRKLQQVHRGGAEDHPISCAMNAAPTLRR